MSNSSSKNLHNSPPTPIVSEKNLVDNQIEEEKSTTIHGGASVQLTTNTKEQKNHTSATDIYAIQNVLNKLENENKTFRLPSLQMKKMDSIETQSQQNNKSQVGNCSEINQMMPFAVAANTPLFKRISSSLSEGEAISLSNDQQSPSNYRSNHPFLLNSNCMPDQNRFIKVQAHIDVKIDANYLNFMHKHHYQKTFVDSQIVSKFETATMEKVDGSGDMAELDDSVAADEDNFSGEQSSQEIPFKSQSTSHQKSQKRESNETQGTIVDVEKDREEENQTSTEVVEQLILGKRRRGRRQSDFKTYKTQTMQKIEELEQMTKEPKLSAKELKRLKNMVSAYESRLVKRATTEDLHEQLEVRNTQVKAILKILSDELLPCDLMRITKRIYQETPQMTLGNVVKKLSKTQHQHQKQSSKK